MVRLSNVFITLSAFSALAAAHPDPSKTETAAKRQLTPVTRVYWEVGDSSWKTAAPEVQAIGISRYRLYNNSFSIYDYTLDFTNTKGWCFRFFDFSGDFYDVSTVFNGDHELDYNSGNPTINGVLGSCS